MDASVHGDGRLSGAAEPEPSSFASLPDDLQPPVMDARSLGLSEAAEESMKEPSGFASLPDDLLQLDIMDASDHGAGRLSEAPRNVRRGVKRSTAPDRRPAEAAESQPSGFDSLPDDLQLDILRRVSEASQGFAHALVCKKWRVLAARAQATCTCSCKGTGQPEEENAEGVEASVLSEQLSRYLNLKSLRISASSLPEDFLLQLSDSLRHLWITEQVLYTVETGWNTPYRLIAYGNRLLQGLPRFRSLETLSIPNYAFPTDVWPFSSSLRHLHVGGVGGLSHTYSPESFQLADEGTSRYFWDGHTAMPASFLERLPELRELRSFSAKVADQVTALPECMSELTNLEELDIIGRCLESPFASIGQCQKLRRLLLMTFKTLTLPPSLTQLSALSYLYIYAEDGVRAPPGMAALPSLLTMEVNVFMELPENIEYEVDTLFPVPSIERLRTTCLPSDFTPQTSLQELVFFRFPCVESVSRPFPESYPDSLWRLSRLRTLTLEFLNVTALPEAIRGLTGLEELAIIECWQFEHLPESLAELPRLRKVVLIKDGRVCSLPSSIATWPALQSLHLEDLYDLELPEPVLSKLLLRLRGGLRMVRVELVEEMHAKMRRRVQVRAWRRRRMEARRRMEMRRRMKREVKIRMGKKVREGEQGWRPQAEAHRLAHTDIEKDAVEVVMCGEEE